MTNTEIYRLIMNLIRFGQNHTVLYLKVVNL